MYCKNCGSKIENGNKFCFNCGEKVDDVFIEKDVQENGIDDNTSINNEGLMNSNDEKNMISNNNIENTNSKILEQDNKLSNDINQNVISDNNNNINQSVSSVKPKGKNNKKIVILVSCIIGFLILITIGVLIVKNLFITPKNIFMTGVKKTSNLLTNPLNKDYNDISFDFNIKTNTKEQNQIYDILNKINIKGELKEDRTNKKLNYNFLLDYDKSNLINLDFYANDKTVYLNIKDLYDKTIKADFNSSELFEDNSEYINAYNNVINEITNAIDKSLKDKYFSSSKKNIDINGKKQKLTQNQLKINNENLKQIENDFLSYLYESKNFSKDVVTILNKSSNKKTKEEDIKKYINEAKDGLNNKEIDAAVGAKDSLTEKENQNEEILINIYTKGLKNEFVKFEIINNNNNISIVKNSEQLYNLIYTNGVLTYKLDFNISGSKDNKKINISYKDKANSINVYLNYQLKNNQSIENKKFNNVIDYKNIPENDYEIISNKLQQTDGYKKFSNDIGDIASLLFGINNTESIIDDPKIDTDYDSMDSMTENSDFNMDDYNFDF